jgi:signal transduction histidine kinase
LLNILINAMDASEGGTEIIARAKESNSGYTIELIDHGAGIPEKILDQIFDPYFSTKSSGTGLGLSLTKTIIEKHHGEITIDSTEGRGTTVTIYLPSDVKGA